MVCERVKIGDTYAIVCGRSRRRPKCRGCGRFTATRECDWKVPRKKSGTCDAPLCDDCTFSPAAEKDLCPTHVTAFEAWQAAKKAHRQGELEC